jgi:hypothetical protein
VHDEPGVHDVTFLQILPRKCCELRDWHDWAAPQKRVKLPTSRVDMAFWVCEGSGYPGHAGGALPIGLLKKGGDRLITGVGVAGAGEGQGEVEKDVEEHHQDMEIV